MITRITFIIVWSKITVVITRSGIIVFWLIIIVWRCFIMLIRLIIIVRRWVIIIVWRSIIIVWRSIIIVWRTIIVWRIVVIIVWWIVIIVWWIVIIVWRNIIIVWRIVIIIVWRTVIIVWRTIIVYRSIVIVYRSIVIVIWRCKIVVWSTIVIVWRTMTIVIVWRIVVWRNKIVLSILLSDSLRILISSRNSKSLLEQVQELIGVSRNFMKTIQYRRITKSMVCVISGMVLQLVHSKERRDLVSILKFSSQCCEQMIVHGILIGNQFICNPIPVLAVVKFIVLLGFLITKVTTSRTIISIRALSSE